MTTPKQPDFKYTFTSCATEKELFKSITSPVNLFISNLLKRGHNIGVKDGSGLIAATFVDGGRLEGRDLDQVTGLILDIDGKYKHPDGSSYTERIDPDLFLAKIPWRGVAHTSFNHSNELPKFRVILPLETPITVDEFHRLWWWVYELTDKKIDPTGKTPSRMYYLPRCTAEARDAGLPWIRALRGEVLDVSVVPANYQPPELASVHIFPHAKQGAHDAPAIPRRFGDIDTHQHLEHLLALPLYKWAAENPGDVTREVWRGLATNIAAVVLEDKESWDEGGRVFHELSEPDQDRYNYGVTQKTWVDALKSAQHPGPMTYATMITNSAPESVWVERDQKSPVAHARRHLLDELRQAKKNATPAMALEYANVPNKPDDATLIDTIKGIEKTTVDVSLVEEANGKNDADVYGGLEPWYFLKDLNTGKFLQRRTPTSKAWAELSEDGLTHHLHHVKRQKRKQQDQFREGITGFHERRAVFTSDKDVIQDGFFTIFNTFQPTSIQPVAGDWSDIHAIIFNLVGKDVSALEYVLNWIAGPLQSLYVNKTGSRKMGTALVLMGNQGSGKGTLSDILRRLYSGDGGRRGSHFLEIGQNAFDGQFNGFLEDKLFVAANEIVSWNNRSGETANKIKSWVTDEYLLLEAKHKNQEQTLAHFNLMVTSNDERPVQLEYDDRRYNVFKSTTFTDLDLVRRLHADLRDKQQQLSAFFADLLQRQVVLKMGDLYKNNARVELIDRTRPCEEVFAQNIKQYGWVDVASFWTMNSNKQNEPRVAYVRDGWVPHTTFHMVFKEWCRFNNYKAAPTIAKIHAALRNIFGDGKPNDGSTPVPNGVQPDAYGWYEGKANRVIKGLPMQADPRYFSAEDLAEAPDAKTIKLVPAVKDTEPLADADNMDLPPNLEEGV